MVQKEVDHTACKTYSLSWSDFSVSLSSTVQTFRNEEDLTDVTLCAGAKIFPAHRLVLSAASPLLMELLRNSKCQHPILMLAGIAANDLEIILDFVYKGEINVTSDRLPTLLQAAQFLDIRALSSAALVLNSSETAIPLLLSVITDKDTESTGHKNPSSEIKNDDISDLSQKKEIVCKTNEGSQFNAINSSSIQTKIDHPEKVDKETHTVTPQPGTESTSAKFTSHDVGDLAPFFILWLHQFASAMVTTEFEEKKIISDLPVNCKLCGVTIRQSRNLRRHIDQMHLKWKNQPRNGIKRKKKLESKNCNVPTSCSLAGRSSQGTKLSLTDDFSQDSFSQLTDEILNYSAGSESEENSFPNTVTISPTSNYSGESVIASSTCSTSSSSIVKTQNLSTLLEEDICFQLPTKNDSRTTRTATPADGSSVEGYCSNLDEACPVGDMTLKDLENQLFSACFCTSENI